LYNQLKKPAVGIIEKNVPHIQLEPVRSQDNFHDDYTPKWVKAGNKKRNYTNKCHGWNLLKLAFENNLEVVVFDKNIRNSKNIIILKVKRLL
jgi:hypothetical protein